jgi:hypothetical protein
VAFARRRGVQLGWRLAFDEQQDSDPLPYQQIHRSAIALSALIGNSIGISQTDALGRLVMFWFQVSEPRALEALISAGKTAVVLPEAEARARVKMAFGPAVEVDTLVLAGALANEPGGGFRVRGMSRQLETIRGRIQRRMTSIAGGKASAAARTQKTGSAMPKRTALRKNTNRGSTAAEPPTNPEDRGQRTEERGKIDPDLFGGAPAEAKTKKKSLQVEDYEEFQKTRRGRFEKLGVDFVADEPPNFMLITNALKRIAAECADEDELWSLFDAYLQADFPAKYDPPYKFSAFTSAKVWPGLLRDLRGQPREAQS